jgi:6-phosphogluconate dehydrogenase
MGMLGEIESALKSASADEMLTTYPINERLKVSLTPLRNMVRKGLALGTSTATLHSALNYLQEMQRAATAQKLIQAQRDYFGAHGFSRVGSDTKENFPWAK